MAKISKSNPLSSWGFTTPSPLNSTLNQLREVTGDDTKFTDTYVCLLYTSDAADE